MLVETGNNVKNSDDYDVSIPTKFTHEVKYSTNEQRLQSNVWVCNAKTIPSEESLGTPPASSQRTQKQPCDRHTLEDLGVDVTLIKKKFLKPDNRFRIPNTRNTDQPGLTKEENSGRL